MRRVYVTQFGTTWSLTPQAWQQACECAVANREWNWDDLGHRLRRKLSKWDKQHTPLNWSTEAWAAALQDCKENSHG